MSYTVAIRTLGKSPQLKTELEEIYAQSIKPERVIIYIAEGYEKPDFRIADEEYEWVKRGMVNQRLLSYDDIRSDYILMLDDDVALQPDSMEKLLNSIKENDADLIGADTFRNHRLPLTTKIKGAVSNFVFPHFSQKWAFKIHKNGSFSYINNPEKDFYPSQSCAGNAMLWKTASYKQLRMQDELWLDDLPFAYGDDMLESYKVFKNGMKPGVVFDSGITHLDNQSASGSFRKSPEFIKDRTKAMFSVWWRTCFKPGDTVFFSQLLTATAFSLKMTWLFFVFLSLSIVQLDCSYIANFLKGLSEGWKFVHSETFRSLPPYVIK